MPATFVPIHAAGDGAWTWHLLAAELEMLGHETVAIDLPADDESAGLWDYADAVAVAVGGRSNLIVVAHSFGAFTGPLVCERVKVDQLVMLSAMIPTPGEAPADWWANTGHAEARQGHDDEDEMTTYYHDVPPALAAEAMRRVRNHPSDRAYSEPWPLAAWPDVSTRSLLCRDDRLFPVDWMRGVVRQRLGIIPDEIDGGHCVMLSRPAELARRLDGYAAQAA
jgi:pimeloyl-ACP methyl ester carboxylesterase